MTSPEHTEIPHLTRKQLREIRNTAATPIITADGVAPAPPTHPTAIAAPLPHPSDPASVPPAPEPDSSVDLEAVPKTRRQARQQERIRTASVPVITAEVAAEYQAAKEAEAAAALAEEAELEEISVVEVEDVETDAVSDDVAESEAVEDDVKVEDLIEVVADETESERPVIDSSFGAELLAGTTPEVAVESSFDQLLTLDTSSSGSTTAAHALILTQSSDTGGLVAPVTATGEVIITGTFNLPEGLGSTGHAPGVTDGKDVDAVLIDGELPAASSPTPIAASAAVSTSKTAGEIIRPPAPEKGGRLMMVLAITAGALALALAGVLVLSFTTGAFG